MIAPFRANRIKPPTQDRRRLSRYMRRWPIRPRHASAGVQGIIDATPSTGKVAITRRIQLYSRHIKGREQSNLNDLHQDRFRELTAKWSMKTRADGSRP
jgi:hypothetical protein